jgi:hypothetical protein
LTDERESSDVALIHGRTPDGEGLNIIRKRQDRLEVGAVHPLKNGAPISGEVVSLTPRKEFPLLCDVKVEVPAPHSAASSDVATPAQKGPPQVATDRYRENWDRIWKGREEPELLS